MQNKELVLFGVAVILFTVGGCTPSGLLIKPVSVNNTLEESAIHRDEGIFVLNKIAVIDVDGLMVNMQQSGFFGDGENPVSLFGEKLEMAQNDDAVKAVVLRINSPGGSVAASDAMHHMLLKFKHDSDKPVVACLLDVAASGGYYLACGADGIMAQPSTITGSIGTIMQTVNFAGTMDKLGIEAVAIKSGELKDLASPLKPLPEKEKQLLQEIIQKFYNQFLDVVLAGRTHLDRDTLKPLADGRVFTADQAKEADLIDRIGYPMEAVAWAKKLADVDSAKTVIYGRPYGHKPNVYASTSIHTETSALINIELPFWLKNHSPQFLYLWQPALD